MELSLVVSSLIYFVSLQMLIQGCNGCLENERIGLLQIKADIVAQLGGDAENELASWVDDGASNCCAWERVMCSNISTGHVTHLSLRYILNHPPDLMLNVSLFRPFEDLLSLDLSGTFGGEWINTEGFSRLKKLEALDLSDNGQKRSILPSLNGLTSLRTLNLYLNNIYGSFYARDFVNFRRLELLNLSSNIISGYLYAEDLSSLRSLKVLDLSNNRLNGLIQGLQNYNSLKALDLRNNRLNSSIQGLCEMKDLVELDLSDNMISGQIPECLGILKNLQVLDLSNNQFNGSFPSFISNFTSLVYLSLSGNYIQGSFSLSTLANHSKLQVLYISSKRPGLQIDTEKTEWVPTFQLKYLILLNCNLNKDNRSVIPSFLQYQYDLQYISLSHNKIVGPFPSWLVQNSSRLKHLFLRNNSFVGNLQLSSIRRDLLFLDISNNNINGSLPSDIGIFLPSIQLLNLSMNSFEGNIPGSIGDMKNLWYLDLSHNHFSGKLPEQLATNCIYLQYLRLSNNILQGDIPKSSNWRLLELYLNNNNFTGTIKEVLANHRGLIVVDISNNSISGAIPSSIGMFSDIQIFLMAENQLEGEIPFGFSSMTSLEILNLSENKLSGSIPHFNPSSLRFLYLQKNALSGTIPFTLSESSKLVTLDLRDNKFSGNIPYWMNKMSNLRVLLLGGNNFQGEIPNQLCQLKHVTIMDLSCNMINGTIPSCFSNLSFGMEGYDDDALHLQLSDMVTGTYFAQLYFINSYINVLFYTNYLLMYEVLVEVEFRTKSNYYSYGGHILENMTGLDLSCNKLTGIIPPQIGNLQQIHAMNLSHNYLSGSIPNTFSNLTQIESLDLSYNNLTGEIPSQLTKLNFLSDFNVSYNNLSGITPSAGQFQNFDDENYKGNPGLCGPLLKQKCKGATTSPPSQSNNTGGKETTVDMVAFYWSFTASYITILLGFITVLCINAYWRMAWFYFIGKVIRRCFPNFPLY